ncbi:hypothetical protein [Agrobacterium pusense]|uniref:hypothetical protein n=1 Tax=Agrobacterium pusense TaxID=648995 RepID=UPI001F158471|nr:hypothetical protein [Agrobacterium pusense]WCK24635.1 hypothetical protein CFBP5496_0003295 [Agrobacterium pusense]
MGTAHGIGPNLGGLAALLPEELYLFLERLVENIGVDKTFRLAIKENRFTPLKAGKLQRVTEQFS